MNSNLNSISNLVPVMDQPGGSILVYKGFIDIFVKSLSKINKNFILKHFLSIKTIT